MQSRRTFIGACAAGVAALGLGPVRVFGFDTAGLQAFTYYVGASFYLASYSGADQGIVRLYALEELSTDDGVDQFNLLFIGKRGVSLPEGRYAATNWGRFPDFDVHVQPADADRWGRMRYRASFAQLVDSDQY